MNRAFAGVHHYQGLACKGLGAVAELTKASISISKSSFSIYKMFFSKGFLAVADTMSASSPVHELKILE